MHAAFRYLLNGNSSPMYSTLVKGEDELDIDEPAELRRTIRRLKQCLFAVILLLVVLAVLVSGHVGRQALKHDSDSPVPRMPAFVATFALDNRFAGPSTSETDRAWVSLMPPGGGFIAVHDHASYSLPPGLPSPGTNASLYDISLFHQLHCLTQIRTYLFTLSFAVEQNNTQQVIDILLSPQEDHIFHCFDYLRQAIMCSGDLTIEWPREEHDGRRFAFDGWGVPHHCVNWDAISEFMRDNAPAFASG